MLNRDEMTDEEFTRYVAETQEWFQRYIQTDLLSETMLDVGIEDFQEEISHQENSHCVRCPQMATIRDALHLPWCADHQTRGDFVNIMAARKWRELIDVEFEEEHRTVKYSIATGAWFTATVALCGSDEAITALAMAAIVREERAA